MANLSRPLPKTCGACGGAEERVFTDSWTGRQLCTTTQARQSRWVWVGWSVLSSSCLESFTSHDYSAAGSRGALRHLLRDLPLDTRDESDEVMKKDEMTGTLSATEARLRLTAKMLDCQADSLQ